MDKSRHAVNVYTKGTVAWFEDKQEAWVSATCRSNTITEDGKVKLIFEDDIDNSKEHVFESTLAEIAKKGGSNLPPLRNPPKMEYTDDLTSLSYLNEPAVLNTIRTRYMQHLIYTYSGIVLIAVNPFDRVSLYEPDIVQQYAGRRRGELEPHLFAIAEDAYRCMISDKMNQTIVVSGESGAGKTVSAKFIMRYFATADDQESTGKKKKSHGSMTEVEEQILATNPIMEAFGNAKTTRNDNSSRFGKYIEIQFDKRVNIIGAKIRTYLLERSRLNFQPATERNYHIFYQLCAGVPTSEKKEFRLGEYTQFHYLNQSGTGTIPGVDDAEEFEITQKALSTVGLSHQLQWQIFRILAALLHVGNIQITGRADATIAESDQSLSTATHLLGIRAADFKKWIIRKQITTRSEKIITNLKPDQALVVRDSVAKYIYAHLFDWLVGVINESLTSSDPGDIFRFIGVLDIYGFEHFEKNSFEQFCINYANEKLQQQFNQHVFKLEQEEYLREKINWTFIEFSDNQKCIDLIEGRLGILSLLDEESRLPSGNDKGFCQKLYTSFNTPDMEKYFKKPRFSNEAFTIAHYAHDVEYQAENFIEKNKDTVPEEHLALLNSSEFEFLKEMLDKAAAINAQPITPEKNKRTSLIARKPTLGFIFKQSLVQLMDTIGETNVHYIRCIKPNEAKAPWEFEPNMVLSQLRACGVLETIRISCLGYPSRWTFEEFADRYYALVPSKYWSLASTESDIHKLCDAILDVSVHDKDQYQIGSTKIFFRAGQLAHLERLRLDRFNACATLLQKYMRRFINRSKYLHVQKLVLALQCVARQRCALAAMKKLREESAALRIQTAWRRYIARKTYLNKLRFIVDIQTAIRKRNARRAVRYGREIKAAVCIQRIARGWFARRRYNAQRAFIIHLQSIIRRRRSRKEFDALKVEARSASHYKEVSYRLESKVVELTQTIAVLNREKADMVSRIAQLEVENRTWKEKHDKIATESQRKQMVPVAELVALQNANDLLVKDNKMAENSIKAKEQEIDNTLKALEAQKRENEKLQQLLREREETALTEEEQTELIELRSQVAALKQQLTQAMRAPRREGSTTNMRGLSPSPLHHRNVSSSPVKGLAVHGLEDHHRRSKSPSSGLVNRKARRSSMGATSVPHKTAERREKGPRPTSIDQYSSLLSSVRRIHGNVSEDPAEEIHTIMGDEGALITEINEYLIKDFKIPLPRSISPLSEEEVFFPASTIGLCVTGMWRFRYIEESERLLFTIMDSIQRQCLSYTGDNVLAPCTFWLSNVHELLSILSTAEREAEEDIFRKEQKKPRSSSSDWADFEKLMMTIKFELQCLEDNIYHALVRQLKVKLSKMIVPAVIESQSLPGFVTADSSRFFQRFMTGSTQPAFTMQIQYNLTRIDEWCKVHEMPEGPLQLEHLFQSSKLLQLKKDTIEDIESIYEVCPLLSPTQVQKLIAQYRVADYENPIKPEILKVVAAHVVSGDANDILLLDSIPMDDTSVPFDIPPPRTRRPQNHFAGWVMQKPHVCT
ncbi:P-loop containing nucleoside triphosphate hydrolase protein [Dichotomocladium elegans]|nr:P-loop containing nucleoside triphosphate hydrolase protein [Dichotomocladium elegans]